MDMLVKNPTYLSNYVTFDPTDLSDLQGLIPIKVGRWFQNGEWIGPYHLFYSYQRLMEKEKGAPAFMGCVAWLEDELPLADKYFNTLTKPFADEEYNGFYGYEFILGQNNVTPLSVFTHMLFPHLYPINELVRGNWYLYFDHIQHGNFPVYTVRKPAVLITVTSPPFPFISCPPPEADIHEKAFKHVYSTPVAHCVTALGETDVNEGRRRALRTVNNMNMDITAQYRTDIGLDWANVRDSLIDWGFMNAN